jgi:hypothetical protein
VPQSSGAAPGPPHRPPRRPEPCRRIPPGWISGSRHRTRVSPPRTSTLGARLTPIGGGRPPRPPGDSPMSSSTASRYVRRVRVQTTEALPDASANRQLVVLSSTYYSQRPPRSVLIGGKRRRDTGCRSTSSVRKTPPSLPHFGARASTCAHQNGRSVVLAECSSRRASAPRVRHSIGDLGHPTVDLAGHAIGPLGEDDDGRASIDVDRHSRTGDSQRGQPSRGLTDRHVAPTRTRQAHTYLPLGVSSLGRGDVHRVRIQASTNGAPRARIRRPGHPRGTRA